MKDGTSTTANVVLSLYQGTSASGTLLGSLNLTHTAFCSAPVSAVPVANCGQFNDRKFQFSPTILLTAGTTYFVTLTSTAPDVQSEAYFIKSGGQTFFDASGNPALDLTITKSHVGNFVQGSTGNTYTVTVVNSIVGDKPAGSLVTVTEAPPVGLTVTAMSGSGWTCTTLPTCTRSDVLTAGSSYPPITVTVSVAANATSPLVNSVSVGTAASETDTTNNTATDSTVITAGPQPDLTLTKTHTGNFVQGSTGNTYSVTVTNVGSGIKPAGDVITVTEAPPSGLTVTGMGGTGWTCTTLPVCTRSDALAVTASYPPITVTVSVAANASTPLVNSVSVGTSGIDANPNNNTATDSTVITQPDLTITKMHTGNFVQGSTGNTYSVTVTNSGVGEKLAGALVTVTDNPPAGLTVTAMSGTGWTCTTLPTCTRSDLLAPTGSYPPITVTVSVAIGAALSLVNSISVSTTVNESNTTNNTATDTTVITQPDLTITKTHSGNFIQGSTGNNYSVIVTNSGVGDKLAGSLVTVTEAAPVGLTVTAMSGTGWNCTTLPTCTRNDALAPAGSYPPITVTISVAASASTPLVNSISVTTPAGTESNTSNNTATDSTIITVGAQPDLTITKTHSGSFAQGSTGNIYTVTVTNSGTGDKLVGDTITVTDATPAGLTVTAMSGTGWTCTTLPTCTRTDVLLAGNSYPLLTVTVSVAANAATPLVNSISVATSGPDANPSNNTATDSTVITQPDLTISKTHTGNFVQGSTGNNYSVTVTNSGTGAKLVGDTVTVTDAPPSGLTVTAMSGGGWTCTTLPTCTRTDVLLAGNSYPPITVTVSVTANATSPQMNSISVATTGTDSNPTNNTATDSTNITQPDLTITKTHSGNFVQGSTGNTYSVIVTNFGAGDKIVGSLVTVTESVPAGLTVTAMSGTGWTCTTLPTCTRTDVLAPTASYAPITVTVSVAANATSPQVNSISVSTAANESDTGNNTAADSTVITQPDLTITKTHTGNFVQGSTGNNYSVTVTNSGVGDKLAGILVTVTDVPPSGLTVTAMSGTGWTCTTLPTCTRNDLLTPAGSYPPITVTVSVAASASTPLVNSISVTTPTGTESNAGNNTAADSTIITVGAQPDLTITKSHTGNFVQGSTGNTYSVTVTNSGTGDKLVGDTITVTDTTPAGLTVTGMSGSGWNCTTLPTCTRSDVLLAGNSYPPITVTVSVTVNATSPQVNSIGVVTTGTEANPANNTATDSTVITQPDLTITKIHSGNFLLGSTGNTYSVTVTNSGAGDKLAGILVSVNDVPPVGLTVTAMSGTGWTCTTLPACTRTDLLTSGSSYPAITVTVSVTANATSPQVNSINITTPTGTESNIGNNSANDSTVITRTDLTITKTHTGNFVQGSTGNTYTVTVTNSGTGDKPAGDTITVTDAPPSGLTVTAMSGTGWTCTTLPTCTRTDVLASGASYPAITVTVSVTANATTPQVNSISVTTTGTDGNPTNNSATDSTVITQPDLTITKTHTGNFGQGSTGNTYSVTVTNSGAGSKLAGILVTVTEAAPAGLTVTGMVGSGWTCTTLPSCTRTDVLLSTASYAPITVTVSVSGTATSPQVNTVSVTTPTGTESSITNNTATDSTVIAVGPQPDLTITKSHQGSFTRGQIGATYTFTVTNSGSAPTDGSAVTVSDFLAAGFTATAASGSGWTCLLGPPVSCQTTAVLAVGSSFPPITLTVNVALDAPASIVNVASVSGGGDVNPGNNTANDPTTVDPLPPDTYLLRYASNLNSGDSVINIINTGANGAALNGPGFGGQAGNICVNAYTFSPDEQLVSCCSCLITPNGLASLSVNSDLVSNTLTGVIPNSVVIKLVNTAASPNFTGTNCTNSAALAGTAPFPLAGGVQAFGTTLHAGTQAGTSVTTETPFKGGTLSPGELASITNRCANIVGNGSTFGVCRSCRQGGLSLSR